MKKQFKTQLFTTLNNYPAEQLVLAAARSNSGAAPITLKSLKAIGEGMQETFPELWTPTTIELIDNRLHIDCKGLNGWEQAAIIEEVEVFEIVHVVNQESDVIF